MLASRPERIKHYIATGSAFGVGAFVALAIPIFLFAWVSNGFNLSLALDWVRKLLPILSSLALISSGYGIWCQGDEEWPYVLLVASFVALVLCCVLELMHIF